MAVRTTLIEPTGILLRISTGIRRSSSVSQKVSLPSFLKKAPAAQRRLHDQAVERPQDDSTSSRPSTDTRMGSSSGRRGDSRKSSSPGSSGMVRTR